MAENSARIQRGRPFPKGTSGNLAGKPKGARHRATIAAETLMSGEADAIVRAVIEKAKTGDMVAAKMILDRVAPLRKGRPMEIDLPPAKTPDDLVRAFEALIAAMTRGEASPDEAMTIAGVLGEQRRALELTEIEQRLRAVEERSGRDK